jgi:hypothetical protein
MGKKVALGIFEWFIFKKVSKRASLMQRIPRRDNFE